MCTREYPNERTHCADDGIALVALSTGASARPEDQLGQVVDGRYRIERIIGRGGMGTVYACQHVVVGKGVAMKVLKPGVDRSEGVLQRFIREAQTANAIRSRHIVETFDFGQLPNGCFFVVMELLEGMDLTRVMRKGLLNRDQLKHVFIQVAETLHLAHAQGIVHRDLKPDNVFLVHEAGDQLFVKLLEFGIAKILHGDPTGLTDTGVILGTPYYMSPEQARAEAVDHRSDVYALGVMMYRAFTGRLPFVADSTMGVLTRHITDMPELPSRITEIDVQTERVILRCLEKRPIDRFQTMNDVAEALRSLDAPGHRPLLRDDSTVAEGARSGSWSSERRIPVEALHTPTPGPHPTPQSGPHPAFGSGPYSGSMGTPPPTSTPSGPGSSGPYPSHVSGPHRASHASLPPGYPGEPTSRGLVTSSTGAPGSPRRSAIVVISGAFVMAAVGAAVAFGLYGRPGSGNPTASTSPPAEPSEIAAPPSDAPAPPATTAEPAMALPSATSGRDARPAGETSSADPATSVATPHPGSPGTSHAQQQKTAPAQPPPTASVPPRRPSEIRSPFE